MTTGLARKLSWARAGYGAALLSGPNALIRLASGAGADNRARTVARLLGGRQLAQALVTATRPGQTFLALGAAVDVAHALSMVALASTDSKRRRVAALDAVAATALAAAGLFAAASPRAQPKSGDPQPDTGNRPPGQALEHPTARRKP